MAGMPSALSDAPLLPTHSCHPCQQPTPHPSSICQVSLLKAFYQIHFPCLSRPSCPAGNLLPVQKALVGDGPLDKVLCSVVEDHGVGLLALQLLPGTKAMPQHMLALLRSCRCATLIYSDAPARASMLRKSGALRTSMRLLHSELAKVREAIAAENGETQGER